MDFYIFNLINGWAGKWFWLDGLGIFFAKYFEYFLIFFLLLFLANHVRNKLLNGRKHPVGVASRPYGAGFRKYWWMVISAFLAAVISRFVITDLIRYFFPRMRPFVENSVNLLINHSAGEPSFPSGHAAFYFALATVVYCYHKKAGAGFFVGAFLISLSRIFVGIHWPADILAGAIVGIFVGWLVFTVSKNRFANRNPLDT